jgi:hypothetical protein
MSLVNISKLSVENAASHDALTLMPLSGELRVPEVEKFAEDLV